MAGFLPPALEAAAAEAGPVLSAYGVGLLGGTAATGNAHVPDDISQDKAQSQAAPIARTLPRSTEKCKKCPPETGMLVKTRHGANWNAYRYQARITGFAFDTEACAWSNEWKWMDIAFDGFKADECLLQEAKGNYDQFLDGSIPNADKFFTGFDKMRQQIVKRAVVVKLNPPTSLIYYFQTPMTQAKMMPTLRITGTPSVLQP